MFFVNARAFVVRTHAGNETEIVIQKRAKSDSDHKLELPGGRLELYESLTQALIREVKEETGLDVYEIEGSETRVDTVGIDPAFEVEVIRPFAAYQTTKGSIDSVGVYFRCKAEGELLAEGDETRAIRWIAVRELAAMFRDDPLQFSSVDRAGIKFYLRELGLLDS